MNKKTTLSIVLIAIFSSALATWFVQYQISEIETKNGELRDQNSDLQNQLSELQLQNREQQDRLTDFTYQLALRGYLSVKIATFSWLGGFNPVGGMLLDHPVNVTIQNNDVVPLSGLTLTVRLANKDTGAEIGDEGVTRIDRLNAGESREITGRAYTTLGTSLKDELTGITLNDAVCVTTLKVGDIVLDEWTRGLS